MFEVRILRGRKVFDAGLVERIVEFDKRNMLVPARLAWLMRAIEISTARHNIFDTCGSYDT